MCARKTNNLDNYFVGAKQSKQLSAAEDEILELRAEIEKLRSQGDSELESQLAILRSQLQSQSGIQSVPMEEIEPNPDQPRQTFLPESIESMSRSLASDGQLQPVILIKRDKFLIFDGERRWRSAKSLGWQTIEAVIVPEPANLHRKALLTSLHREDLNPLDKAEAVLWELANTTELETEDIPRILSTVVRRLNAQKRMNSLVELISAKQDEQKQGLASLDLSDAEEGILTVLLDLQLNPASIDANIFPMLFLAEDLKKAIRNGLKGVHAMALQKLSAKNLGVTEKQARTIRMGTTEKVISEKLSVIATRQLVALAIANHTQPSSKDTVKTKPLSQEVRRLQKLSVDSLKKVDRSQLVEFKAVLRQKLAEIDELLKQKN